MARIAIAIGGVVDLAALGTLAVSYNDHLARVALGVMIVATAWTLVGVMLVRVRATWRHFDGSIQKMAAEHAATRDRVAAVEGRLDERSIDAYAMGVAHRGALDEAGKTRMT